MSKFNVESDASIARMKSIKAVLVSQALTANELANRLDCSAATVLFSCGTL